MEFWLAGNRGRKFTDRLKEALFGCSNINRGHFTINDTLGLWGDINEKEAVKYPIRIGGKGWIVRQGDSTVIKL